jgi:hypothetical protein
MSEQARADHGHGIDLRAVAWVMAALCGIVLLAAAGAYVAWRSASDTPRQLAPNTPAELRVSGVVLESAPRPQRSAYRAEKERLLRAHEWIDADAGIARVPIDTAMHLLVQRDAARRAAAPTSKRQQ